jgi:hypothetical protein
MYDNGRGVPQDYAQAVAWYRKAAEQGDADAQNNLGLRYDKGQGVPQDYAQAVAWFRKAAEQGNALAQNNLGAMYVGGQGVPRLKVVAYALYNLSAAADASAGNKAVSNRATLTESMNAREIEAGQALTRQLAKPGSLLKALDAYVRKPAVKEVAVAPGVEPAPTRRVAGLYPQRPAKVRGRVSCNTNCTNGDCYRTYDNNRKVHFQAGRNWNPLNSQFEWDSGSC